MIDKNDILEAVSFLLRSANERGTSQGLVVYTKIVEMLNDAKDNDTVEEILGKLNRALAGIEAHGDFTDKEFEKVLFLRKAGVL